MKVIIYMDSISKAIEIANKAHEGQKDKAGKDYILHPFRVLYEMDTRKEQIVAVLHDVVEDSDYTFEDLEQWFTTDIIRTLRFLTHRSDEGYETYIRRLSNLDIARKVKMADIRDNGNLFRLKEITAEDWKRQQKYIWAYQYLCYKEQKIV